jgi:hypothetical protein
MRAFWVVWVLYLLAGTLPVAKGGVTLATRRGGRVRRSAAVASALAFLVNAYWLVLFEDRKDLRPGYYLWWFSFLGIAYLFWRAEGQRARDVRSLSTGREQRSQG